MVKISEIVKQNPWWTYGSTFTTFDVNISKAKPIFFQRKYIALKRGNIYILRGPRQVGKTTYLKDRIKRLIEEGTPARNVLYLSLDFCTSRRELRNSLNYFLDSTRDAPQIYIFLDEITSVPEWNLELKYYADQGITQRAAVFATGSSAVKLKEKGELLPGRGVEGNEFFIKPLSFREFIRQSIGFIVERTATDELRNGLQNLQQILTKCSARSDPGIITLKTQAEMLLPFKGELDYLFRFYLISGGFPAVVNEYLLNRFELNIEMINPRLCEVFVRDVLGDLSRLHKQEIMARQLLKAIVERYGSRYSFSHLSREIERNHSTTVDYLEFMEESFISFVLYAFDFNTKMAKNKGDKKVYFFDPFIFHAFMSYLEGEDVWQMISATLQDGELQSKVVEGIVISHLRLHNEIPLMRTGNSFLWNYYDKQGKEIDTILRTNGRHLGIEVKYGNQVTEKDVHHITPIREYLILSKDDYGVSRDTMILPVDVFLSLLKPSERNV